MRRRIRFALSLAAMSLVLSACTSDPGEKGQGAGAPQRSPAGTDVPAENAPPASRWSHPEIKEQMLADLQTVRSPADGGGRAWIEGYEEPGRRPRVEAGSRARFELIYEAGPLGVARGGTIFLQVSPFWGWDTPQIIDPSAPAYTEISTSAPGVILEPKVLGQQLLAIGIQGRALEAGERVCINYGADPRGAKVDRFAEDDSRLWIAVDGDGDGVRKLIPESPGVDVHAGPPALIHIALPGTARPGQTIPLTIAALDRAGNMGAPLVGEVELSLDSDGSGLEIPERVSFSPSDQGRRTIDVQVIDAGLYRVRGVALLEDGRSLEAESNPMLASPQGATLLWGDLQGHTQLSDGSATPAQYFEYGRDAAGLDFVAVTDHDHWGLEALDGNPELWEDTIGVVRNFHEPGRYVALLGFEWTNWVEGHRHVVHFGEDEEDLVLLSSLDPAVDTPTELWKALEGQPVLTIAHHSAGGPVPIDWSIPPDPILEPMTEIASVHGSSEAPDAPRPIYNPRPGNYVRDALDRGYRLGFTGGSDGHDGHPGLAQIAGGSSGVAAVWSDALEPRTRPALLAGLRNRRGYATNGPRMLVQASFDGRPMGADVPIDAQQKVHRLAWNVAGTGAIERIDVIRRGNPVVSIDAEGLRDSIGVVEIPLLEVGDYLYLRVVQEDGGAAWTSPFQIVRAPPAATSNP